MPQLIVDPITAILTIDTNIVTKYLGINKDIKQKKCRSNLFKITKKQQKCVQSLKVNARGVKAF